MDSDKIKAGVRPYLEQDEYAWTYYEMQKQARLFWLPFNEYERLADNDVREDLAPNMPKVNDGSLSDLLEKTVERVLGQPYTGTAKVIESIDPQTKKPTYPQPWLQEIVNFVWDKKIIPNANTQASFFRKQQMALKKALTYGSQPVYTFYRSDGFYRGSDMSLPYIRDVYLEVGKSSDRDCDYIMMDSYYTKLQLARLIAQANKAAEVGVQTTWNVEELKKIYNGHLEAQKDYLAKNKAERNRPVRATLIKFTTVFQRGVKAPFDTFWNGGGADASMGSATIVRTKINEDPTGDIPIHFMYAYDDLVNPYGTGQIKKSGGTQNVLDYLTQLHVLATQIGLQPPITIEGETSDTDIKSMIYAPNQYWFTGGAKVDIMETGSTQYREFPQAYGLYKSNLVNAQGQAPVDISGESGNPINSKVPAAIKQRQSTMSEFDNHMRNQVFACMRPVTRNMLNIHFANMQGEDLEKLEADDAIKLTRAGLIPPDPANPNMPSTQQVILDWDQLRGKFDFEIDPDSVMAKDNQEQIQELSSILDLIQQNPYMLQYITKSGYELNVGEIYRAIITKLGLKNVDKILEPMSAQDKANAGAVPPMVFDKPSIQLHYPDMPPEAQLQLLQRLGLNVTLLDVLMGPVGDMNIRGVYQPEPQPGNANNPIDPDQVLGPEEQQQNIPPTSAPQSQVVLPKGATVQPGIDEQPPNPMPNVTPASAAPGASAAPTPPDPAAVEMLKQTMAEHGVNQQGGMAIMHAKASGIPDQDIINHMKKNGIGKYGNNNPLPGPPNPKRTKRGS